MERNPLPNNLNHLFSEQRMAVPTMDMAYMQMANHMNYLDSVQRIYPDCYRRMMPYVDRASGEIEDPSGLTEPELARITHDIVHKSNILNDPPGGHNEMTLKDLAGVMLLSLLFDGQESYYPPYTLPFLVPYGRRHRGGLRYMMY